MNKMRAELLRRAHWGIYHALVEKDLTAVMQAFDKHYRIVQDQLDKMMQKTSDS